MVGFDRLIGDLEARTRLTKAETSQLADLWTRQARLMQRLGEARKRVVAEEAARLRRRAARAAEMRRLGREELDARLRDGAGANVAIGLGDGR